MSGSTEAIVVLSAANWSFDLNLNNLASARGGWLNKLVLQNGAATEQSLVLFYPSQTVSSPIRLLPGQTLDLGDARPNFIIAAGSTTDAGFRVYMHVVLR